MLIGFVVGGISTSSPVPTAESVRRRFSASGSARALVQRNIGGRITPAVIQDIAYTGYLVDTEALEGPYFEVAIIHHIDGGSALLAAGSETRVLAVRMRSGRQTRRWRQ